MVFIRAATDLDMLTIPTVLDAFGDNDEGRAMNIRIDFAHRLKYCSADAEKVKRFHLDDHNNLVLETSNGTLTINARQWVAFEVVDA